MHEKAKLWWKSGRDIVFNKAIPVFSSRATIEEHLETKY